MNSLWPQIPHVDRFFSGSPLTALLKADAAPVPYDYATALIRITVVNKSLVTDLKMRCIRSLNEELFQGRLPSLPSGITNLRKSCGIVRSHGSMSH